MSMTEMLLQAEDVQTFTAGTSIFEAGTPGDVLYVVLEGKVDILVHGKVIDKVSSGGIIGEMALIDTQPRSATATASTDCRVVPINEERFSYLIQETPEFALQVMKVVVQRLRLMNEQV